MKTSTRLPVRYLYWTKAKGVKGTVKTPEDFVVREQLDGKFFSRFSHGRAEPVKGKYSLWLLAKRNLTTEEAVKIASERLSVPRDNISYAGLKDKFAVTEQYLTIKGAKSSGSVEQEGFLLRFVSFTDKRLSVGDLVSNVFEVTLHGCNGEKLKEALEELRKGFPNYFGLQRFGHSMNNHIIGKCLVERKFTEALEMINACYREHSSLQGVPKERLKFFIHAYQSWLFNEAVNSLVRKKRYYRGSIPLIGCDTKKSSMRMLPGAPEPEKFYLPELRIRVSGSLRKAFIKPEGIKYEIGEKKAKLVFRLPRGSYGTVLLRELEK